MAAPKGNTNASKQRKRIDVHVSIADTKEALRRSIMERYCKSIGIDEPTEQDIVDIARQRLYDWIDGLERSDVSQ